MVSNRVSFFSQFDQFPYFTHQMLVESAAKFEIKKSTFDAYIYRSLKEGQILSLKRNYYVVRSFFEKNRGNTAYLFFLANSLLKPSYISLETALQYYGLFAEAVPFFITSVTTKLPREFQNRGGTYTYRKISDGLFNEFVSLKEDFEFNIARPYKAIFDYLYYQTNRFTKNVHVDLLEELRIDSDALSTEEKRRFRLLVGAHTSIKLRI